MMLKDVSIEIIQRCLNSCVHCSSCSTKDSVLMLDCDTVKRVITGLQELGTKRVCFSGGEPFLHPDLIKIIRWAADKAITVDVYTCGVVETCGRPAALSGELLAAAKKAGLHSLIFNLQSPRETSYDAITQTQGHFSLAKESISNAIQCGLKTELHVVPMKQNAGDVENLLQFAKDVGIAQVNFLKLVPHGRAYLNAEKIQLNDDDIIGLQTQLLHFKEQGAPIRLGLPLSISGSTPPCHAVREKLYIKFDGSVFGCEAFKYIAFQDQNGSPVAPGNILREDIREIYKNSPYLKRSLETVEKFEPCEIGCENCPVQKYLKEQEENQ